MFEAHIAQIRTKMTEVKLAPGTSFGGVLQFLKAVDMLCEGEADTYEGPPVFFYPDCIRDIPQIQDRLIEDHVLARHPKSNQLIPIRRNPSALTKTIPASPQQTK